MKRKKKRPELKPSKPDYRKTVIQLFSKVRAMDKDISKLTRYVEYLSKELDTTIDYTEYLGEKILNSDFESRDSNQQPQIMNTNVR